MKRDPLPTAGMADFQLVKTISVGGEESGYDSSKKDKGDKSHLLVDKQVLALRAKVYSAGLMDRYTEKRWMTRSIT